MAKKIFISYKYGDKDVYPLKDNLTEIYNPTKVRDYVDIIQEKLSNDHINKGEADGEDLSSFKDSTIRSSLRDKIYDSSVTIFTISPNMKEEIKSEKDQWIPWEISYSLQEYRRNGRTSKSNALLSVVLPDKNNSYEYFWSIRNCCSNGCKIFNTSRLFKIISDNMFNLKGSVGTNCQEGSTIFYGNHSYIHLVKWIDFIEEPNKHIDKSISLNENIDNYNISKNIT